MIFKQRSKLNKLSIPFLVNNSRGFTLVELLIVIVIIGILAGIIIGVLNPIQQQRRARDGTTKAQLDKMALSAKSLFASSPRKNDRSPTLAEFAQGFASSPDISTSCTSNVESATTSCLFSINSQPLPTDCSSNGYSGNLGTDTCYYSYWRNPNSFIIAARGLATPQVMFVYYYQENINTGNVVEGFYACPVDYVFAASAPVGCDRL